MKLKTLEDLHEKLSERVSDFPRNTCSDIDNVIYEIKPIIRVCSTIYATFNDDTPRNFVDFVDQVEMLLKSLPSDLDDLRSLNASLRKSLHEALDSRKECAVILEKEINLFERE